MNSINGLRVRLHSATRRIVGRIGYRRMLTLERRLDRTIEAVDARLESTVRKLIEADQDAFAACRQGPFQPMLRKRLACGHECYAAIVDGRIASVSWLARLKATIWAIDADIALSTEECYIYDSYTHPDFRGQRLQAPVFTAIVESLRNSGCTRAITFVDTDNIANLRSRSRMGFEICGDLQYFRLPGYRLYRNRGHTPAVTRHVA